MLGLSGGTPAEVVFGFTYAQPAVPVGYGPEEASAAHCRERPVKATPGQLFAVAGSGSQLSPMPSPSVSVAPLAEVRPGVKLPTSGFGQRSTVSGTPSLSTSSALETSIA